MTTWRACTRRSVLTALAGAVLLPRAARADTPPIAADNILHGFVAEDGVVTTVVHPDAARTPVVQTGTGTLGSIDRGQVVGDYGTKPRAASAPAPSRRLHSRPLLGNA